MKAQLKWTEGMQFEGKAGGHTVMLDAKAPIGKDSGMTPKDFVAVGLGGCTAMDVIALLRKHKQTAETFDVDVDVTSSTGVYPAVFVGATLSFTATGQIDPAILLESVQLSQTKYCGVSAMLAQAFPIEYVVILNGKEIGKGKAEFS
jgi:putative redox protein